MKQLRFSFAIIAAASLLSALSACGGGNSSPAVPATQQAHGGSSPSTATRIRRVTFTAAMRSKFTPHVGNPKYFYSRSYLKNHPEFKWGPNARTTMTSSGSGNLNWNGGPVQTSPAIDVVYWGWQGLPDGNSDPDDIYDYFDGFLNAMAGGGWINIDTQYYGSNGSITNPNPELRNVLYDTSTPPNPYSDSDIQREAEAAASYLGDNSVNVNYIIVTPTGYTTSGFGSQWCAYHNYDGTLSYTDLPYIPDAGSTCGAGSVNSPGTNDGVSIVGGHEEAETQTDPQPSSGWVDASGEENGDKCAWINMGNNGAAGGYATQPIYDNAISDCAQSGP